MPTPIVWDGSGTAVAEGGTAVFTGWTSPTTASMPIYNAADPAEYTYAGDGSNAYPPGVVLARKTDRGLGNVIAATELDAPLADGDAVAFEISLAAVQQGVGYCAPLVWVAKETAPGTLEGACFMIDPYYPDAWRWAPITITQAGGVTAFGTLASVLAVGGPRFVRFRRAGNNTIFEASSDGAHWQRGAGLPNIVLTSNPEMTHFGAGVYYSMLVGWCAAQIVQHKVGPA